MNNNRFHSFLFIACAVFSSMLSAAAQAQNTNTTIQEGKVCINSTRQYGDHNDNTTYQTCKVNINRTTQQGKENRNAAAQFGRRNENATHQSRGFVRTGYQVSGSRHHVRSKHDGIHPKGTSRKAH